MNNQKIGNFIKLLRKEKGLSQNDLSEILHITRQAISNWETGKTAPDPELLIELSNFFQVPINAILLGEKDVTEEQVEKVTIDLLNDNKKKTSKLKRQLIIFNSIILILVFSFLAYYFISTYNSIKIYRIAAITKNFYIQDGLMIHTKNRTYIKIGYIEKRNKEDNINQLKIFLKFKNGKQKLVHTTNDPGADVIEVLKGKDINIKELRNMIYLQITFNENEKESIKLEFTEIFKNDLNNYSKMESNKRIKPVLNEKTETDKDEKNENQEIETVNQEVIFEQEQKLEISVPEINNAEEIKEEKESIDFNQVINILKEKGTNEFGVYKIEFVDNNQIISIRLESDRIMVETILNNSIMAFMILLNSQDNFYFEKYVNYELTENKYIYMSEESSEKEEFIKILDLLIKNYS